MPRKPLPLAAAWRQHVSEWGECRRCEYAEKRRRVCLARGKLPADILIVGEGPGRSEDVLGECFVGPAGQLLDDIIARAGGGDFRIVFGNLVGCIPKGTDGEKVGRPDPRSVKACGPRLAELTQMARPRLVVLAGDDAQKWFDRVVPDHGIPTVSVRHPAWLLRRPSASRGIDIQLVETRLRKAFTALRDGRLEPPATVPGVPRTRAELDERKRRDVAEFGEELPF